MFHDRPNETIGTRQSRWLTYLQYHHTTLKYADQIKTPFKKDKKELELYAPLKVAVEYERGKYSKWETNNSCVCPIDHREILQNEKIIELDNDNRQGCLEAINFLQNYLTRRGVINYLQDHNGRCPHLHVFNMPWNIRLEKNPTLKIKTLDKTKYCGRGLCREIGGTYNHKNGKKYYVSYFQNIKEIKPVTNPEEVRFPCLNLN